MSNIHHVAALNLNTLSYILIQLNKPIFPSMVLASQSLSHHPHHVFITSFFPQSLAELRSHSTLPCCVWHRVSKQAALSYFCPWRFLFIILSPWYCRFSLPNSSITRGVFFLNICRSQTARVRWAAHLLVRRPSFILIQTGAFTSDSGVEPIPSTEDLLVVSE